MGPTTILLALVVAVLVLVLVLAVYVQDRRSSKRAREIRERLERMSTSRRHHG